MSDLDPLDRFADQKSNPYSLLYAGSPWLACQHCGADIQCVPDGYEDSRGYADSSDPYPHEHEPEPDACTKLYLNQERSSDGGDRPPPQ